jgi:hypothetical protein
MRLLTGILLISVSLLPLSGEPLSQGDREYALSALQASKKLFLESVDGLTENQLNFKPAPDKWSIAEVAEHIALAEGFIFQVVQGALQSSAQDPLADARKLDEKILTKVPERTVKFNAPEPLQPHHEYKTLAEAVAAFNSARDSHIDYVRTTQDPLREHFFKHPALGELDAYQWILLISAHTERHVNQILEVKASPGFPKQ